ncbi:MAG: AAA family ATPase, partial [Candidatus Eisenbacteria bacterium]|nr:AAA family ATPase [Candidatus Eisenbacteria bacterium]
MSAETERDEASHPFIATAPARAALPPLLHGFGARAPFVLLTGDAGTGRSWLAAEWVERLADRATPAVLPAPAPLAADMAAALVPLFDGADAAYASTAAATESLMQSLANATAAGRVAVIIADDADRLDDAQLLELRRIADAAAARQCPLEVLLVGAPAFATRLESPAMRDLRARLSVHVPLARFSANDTREYLQSRLSPSGVPCMGLFSRKASRDIHQESLGLVGLVSAIASESLRRAGRDG